MVETGTGRAVSFGRRLTDLANADPERPAIIFARQDRSERIVTRRELDHRSNAVARLLARRGVGQGSFVFVGLPNCPEHHVAALAAWKLGACVMPLSPRLPARERDAIIEVGRPAVVVSDWTDLAVPAVSLAEIVGAGLDPEPLPDRIPHPGKAIGSGGSTGRPKIIVDPSPWARVPGEMGILRSLASGWRSGQIQLVPGALHHNTPFGWGHMGLFEAHTLVLMERFDAAHAVDLIERHRVSFVTLVPTMMIRIARLPDIHTRDLSSLGAIMHTAAMCPPWVKRGWIDLIGPEKVFEGYGSSEAIGHCTIRGDEWLEHPGSVGRPRDCEIAILDEAGHRLPPGQVGIVHMRRHDRATETYRYIGSPPVTETTDGFKTVGDLGWLDEAGYLYLADRRIDMIVTGGANVYPAEVEAALLEHPAVHDVAVIGLPHDEWGRRVHAVIHPRDPHHPPTPDDLDRHCRERLVAYKIPKTYEFVPELPRDEAGKIRRSAMVAERVPAAAQPPAPPTPLPSSALTGGPAT